MAKPAHPSPITIGKDIGKAITLPIYGPIAGGVAVGKTLGKDAGSISGIVGSAGNVLSFATDPVRVGEVLVGVILIGVGVSAMLRINPVATAKKASKTAGKVAAL